MTYWEEINVKLKPRIDSEFNKTVVDLFAGCGGLSLGFEANGFKTIGYEMDEKACETYKQNLLGECIHEKLSVESEYPQADIVIGGPPCPAFSKSRFYRKEMTHGIDDPSFSTVKDYFRVIETLHPKFFDIIRYGKSIGYDRVQTVTNGWKYADRKFYKDCGSKF